MVPQKLPVSGSSLAVLPEPQSVKSLPLESSPRALSNHPTCSSATQPGPLKSVKGPPLLSSFRESQVPTQGLHPAGLPLRSLAISTHAKATY